MRWVLILLALTGSAMAGGPDSFPARIDPGCRGGQARLFDECGDQFAVLAAGQARAEATGKTLLVSVGAEWCIWCHVLDKYMAGAHGDIFYEFDGAAGYLSENAQGVAGDAAALARYSAENFVIVHIENRYAPNGRDVIASLGADAHDPGGIPFTFTVVDGKFRARLPDVRDIPEIEVRREGEDWYRGYDRRILLRELRRLREDARQP